MSTAKLLLLRARGQEASQAVLPPSPSYAELSASWRPPRCPAFPDDHAAVWIGRELHCTWCDDAFDSDGRGGWVHTGRAAGVMG
jgi:hypothetical protein